MVQGRQRQRDYVQQFVDRISDLLQASLSRETWRDEEQQCNECSGQNWAIWRCLDCTLSRPVCRLCLRKTHKHSPLHRVECWTGSHFRRAGLWEVGAYLLVPHHCGSRYCDSLQWQMERLEEMQIIKDMEEQKQLQKTLGGKGKRWMGPAPASHHYQQDDMMSADEDTGIPESWEKEKMSDTQFEQWLSQCNESEPQDFPQNGFIDGEDNATADGAEADVEGLDPYLGPQSEEHRMSGAGAGTDIYEPNTI